jgi:hypothetical protein|tara:strand:- start:2716 stop:2934 length:219 start_codon:yes stop_codon:yes gene_type:complete
MPDDLYLLLGRVEGKVDQLLLEQNRFEAVLQKNDTRITKLEKDKAVMYGAATVLAFIGSGVMWFLSYLLKGS